MENDLKSIQLKILEIASYFDQFCLENNITYYLMGGTALGAMRHKGFIPWDDDFDVFMTSENYYKFLEACEKGLDERFYLQKERTEEWPQSYSKLRMNGTTFIEDNSEHLKMHKGLYIDIMCLNNAYSFTILRLTQYIAARLITTKEMQKCGYQFKVAWKNVILAVVGGILNDSLVHKLEHYVSHLNNRETKYVGHFFGRARFRNTSFPKSYLGKMRYVKFENLMLPVPEKVEQYLSMRYGEKYMEMPDEKTKAKYPSHAKIVDLNRDYKEYEI